VVLRSFKRAQTRKDKKMSDLRYVETDWEREQRLKEEAKRPHITKYGGGSVTISGLSSQEEDRSRSVVSALKRSKVSGQ
jgi:hypothetical protein